MTWGVGLKQWFNLTFNTASPFLEIYEKGPQIGKGRKGIYMRLMRESPNKASEKERQPLIK